MIFDQLSSSTWKSMGCVNPITNFWTREYLSANKSFHLTHCLFLVLTWVHQQSKSITKPLHWPIDFVDGICTVLLIILFHSLFNYTIIIFRFSYSSQGLNKCNVILILFNWKFFGGPAGKQEASKGKNGSHCGSSSLSLHQETIWFTKTGPSTAKTWPLVLHAVRAMVMLLTSGDEALPDAVNWSNPMTLVDE